MNIQALQYSIFQRASAFFIIAILVCANLFAPSAQGVVTIADPYSAIRESASAAEIQSIMDGVYEEYLETQGYVAHAKLKLLEKKYKILPTQTQTNFYSDYYDYSFSISGLPLTYGRPRGRSLLDDAYKVPSGISSYRSATFSEEMDFLTGKRAANETFQFGTIDPARPIDQENRTLDIGQVAKLQVKTHPWNDMIARVSEVPLPPIFGLVPADHFLAYFSGMGPINALEAGFGEIASFGKHFFDLDTFLNAKREVAERLGIREVSALEPLVSEIVFISEDLSFAPKTNFAVAFSLKAESASAIEALIEKGKSSHGIVGDAYVVASSPELYARIQNTQSGAIRSMKNARDAAYAYSVLDNRRDGFIYFSEDFILKLVGPEYRINAGRRAAALPTLNSLQYTVFAYRSITGSWPKTLMQMADEGYVDRGYLKTLADKGYSVDADGAVRHREWGTLREVRAVHDVPLGKVTQAEADRYEQFRRGYESYWREFFDPIGIAVTASDHLYFHTIILPLIDETMYQSAKNIAGGEPAVFEGLADPLRLAPMLFLSKFNFDDMLLAAYDSLNGVARNKGANAAMMANLRGIRSSAELYYDSHGNRYDTAGKTRSSPNTSCSSGLFADDLISPSLKAAQEASGHSPVCYSEENSYAVSVELKTPGIHFCIDSTGGAVRTGASVTSTACGTAALSSAEITRLENAAPAREEKPTREEQQRIVNESLWEGMEFRELGVPKEEFNLFGMLGNEIQVGVGDSLPLKVENIADYDVYVAFKLADTERTKTFINMVYRALARELRGENLGFFSISTDEPLKNVYNDMEYYVIPTGFVNLYFTYYRDYLYASVSQKAINKLIDSATTTDRMKLITPIQRRGIEYVGDKHNLIFSADLTPFAMYKKELIKLLYESPEIAARQAADLKAYLADYRYLKESFSGGESIGKSSFFTLPISFFGLPISVEESGTFLGKERYPFGNVDFGPDLSYSYYDVPGSDEGSEKANSKGNKKFNEFFSESEKAKILEDLNALKGFTVALSFTPEGLDTKVAIMNPLAEKKDARFGADGRMQEEEGFPARYLYIGGGILAAFALAGGSVILLRAFRNRRRKKADGVTTLGSGRDSAPPQIARIEQGTGPIAREPRETDAVQNSAPNPLTSYVKQARASGMSDAAIAEALKGAGWNDGDIAHALAG